MIQMTHHTQDPEEMCLLEYQNPSKTSEKMGHFNRVTVSLHNLPTNLYTATDDDGNDVVK